jgi:hypothetical protein
MILKSRYFVLELDDLLVHRWTMRLTNVMSSDGTILAKTGWFK